MKEHKILRLALRVLILLIFGLLSLGQFQRIELSSRAALYFHDFLFLLLPLILIIFFWKNTLELLKKDSLIRAVVLFVSILMLSLIPCILEGDKAVFIGIAYLFRLLLYFSLYVFAKVLIMRNIIRRNEVKLSIVGLGFALSFFGLLQYVFLPDTRFLYLLGWDDHYYRVISTLFDPGFTALLILVSIILTLNIKTKRIMLKSMVLGTMYIALLLTYSRAVYLAYLISLSYLFLRNRQKTLLLWIFSLPILILLLPRPASEGARLERTASIQARGENIVSTFNNLDTIKDWIIGKGWYMARVYRDNDIKPIPSHSSTPDNSYLHVLESLGFIGLAAFTWLLYTSLKKVGDDHEIFASFLAIGVGSFFNNALFYPWIMIEIWTLLAVANESKD